MLILELEVRLPEEEYRTLLALISDAEKEGELTAITVRHVATMEVPD